MTTLQQVKISCVPPKSVKKNSKQIIQVKGRPIIVSGKHWKKAEKVLTSLLAPHAPASPHEGALCVDVDWVYPYRSSTRKRDLGMMIPCDTRPDKDNLASGLFDVMESLGFWPDDARIAQGQFNKWWGPKPSISITIRSATGYRVMTKEEYTLGERGVEL